MKSVKQVVFEMMTENTGSHMLDSGGAYGRNWERNKKLTIEDFEKRPEATLEISRKYGSDEFSPTVDLFHKLTGCLEIDSICNEFNEMEVSDWDGDFYGVSTAGTAWLKERFEVVGEAFNTYNWDNNFSQIIQGQELKCRETDDVYALVQVHGGCDARGGYTDAKLFKVQGSEGIYELISDNCMFDVIDWMGEWINNEGTCAKDEDFKKLIKKYKVRKGTAKVINGTILNRY
jgi:hypothetical protein